MKNIYSFFHKKITALILIASCSGASMAQNVTADFESYTLTANSAYTSSNSASFLTSNAAFQFLWDTAFGGYWSGGYAYTNSYDSSTAGGGNMYGVKAYKGYNNSNYFVIGKASGIIKTVAPYLIVDGFYVTNTTYAFKSMRLGDAFAKKFGGPSGNDPDFFKITVKGYLNGTMKTDSAEHYLADFRFSNNAQDYISNSWQWVNTSNLGQVDSIQIFMYSSDNGAWGMNTPAFFALDNFTSTFVAGLGENSASVKIAVYPNPFSNQISIQTGWQQFEWRLTDITGKSLSQGSANSQTTDLDLSSLEAGVYFLTVENNGIRQVKRIVRN